MRVLTTSEDWFRKTFLSGKRKTEEVQSSSDDEDSDPEGPTLQKFPEAKLPGPEPIFFSQHKGGTPDPYKLTLRNMGENDLDFEDWTEEESDEPGEEEIFRGVGKANKEGWRDKRYAKADHYKNREQGIDELSKQKGMFMTIRDAGTPEKHVARAMDEFGAMVDEEKLTLEPDLEEALKYHATASTPDKVRRLEEAWQGWHDLAKQLNTAKFRRRAKAKLQATHQYDGNLLLLMCRKLRLGGEQMAKRIMEGHPLTGTFDQPGVFPRKRGRNRKRHLDITTAEQMAELQARLLKDIKRIDKKIPTEEREATYERLMQDVDQGFIEGPYLLHKVPESLRSFLPARIFAASSSGKIRAIVNSLRQRLNDTVEVRTPVSYDSCKQVVACCRELRSRRPSCPLSFLTKDQADAYKSLSLLRSHKRFAAIAVFDPIAGQFLMFYSRTLFFGAEASVISYGIISRLMSALQRRLLGLPALGYVDDSIFALLEEMCQTARFYVSEFFYLIRIALRKAKDTYGQNVTWTGIQFNVSHQNILKLDVSERRRKALLESFAETLSRGSIEVSDLHKMTGRVESIQQVQQGRTGRPYTHVFYRKLYAEVYNPRLSRRFIRAVKFWGDLLKKNRLGATINLCKRTMITLLFYTDATLKRKATFILAMVGEYAYMTEWAWDVPEGSTEECIAVVEMQALSESIARFARIRGINKFHIKCVFFNDNETAANVHVKGYSRGNEDLSTLAENSWKHLAELGWDTWTERVPTDSNPADWGSRHKNKRRSFRIEGLGTFEILDFKTWLNKVFGERTVSET